MRYTTGARIFYDTLAQSLLLEAGPPSAVQLVAPKDNSPPWEDCVAVSKALAGRNNDTLNDPIVIDSKLSGSVPLPVAPFVLDGTEDDHSSLAQRYRALLEERADAVVLVQKEVPQLGCRVISFDMDSRILFEGITDAFVRIIRETQYQGNVLEMPVRFLAQGLRGVQAEFALFEDPTKQTISTDSEIRKFCSAISRTWRYCGFPISGIAVYEWVHQFQPHGVIMEALALLEHLNRDGFIPKYEIVQQLEGLYIQLACETAQAVVPVSIQPAGKSEAMLLYDLRDVKAAHVFEKMEGLQDAKHLVCFDDVIGSGSTILECLFPESGSQGDTRLQNWLSGEDRFITILAALGSDKGMAAIQEDTRLAGKVEVRVGRRLTVDNSIFSTERNVFHSEERQRRFEAVCEEIGRNLKCWGALGWEGLGWCIVTDYNVPDCSLPILWAEGRGDFTWIPLFPRR